MVVAATLAFGLAGVAVIAISASWFVAAAVLVAVAVAAVGARVAAESWRTELSKEVLPL